jgi:branched-subunit amino acid ABC-type transport system permease component
VLLLGAWPCLVLASNNSLAAELGAIPSLAYLITFISSALGGLAGTLHRMSKHLEPGAPGIAHPKIFVGANMLGGLAAGWFSFLLGTQAGTPTLLVQGIVLLSSFGGAAVVERFVDKYLPPTTSPTKD